MAQITHGVRSLLSHPALYTLFQKMLGAHAVRTALVEQFIRPQQGMAVLDIGCGPADILDYLPTVRYWGYDISDEYIRQAESKYEGRGHFQCKILTEDDLSQLPSFDVVLAVGVLHHMDDDVARGLFDLAHKSLKKGGRFITLDPCFVNGQNPLARFLIKRDRGQNVRDENGYRALVGDGFSSIDGKLRHKSGIPYTHWIMECRK